MTNAIRIGWILAALSLGPSGAIAGVIRGMIVPASPRSHAELTNSTHLAAARVPAIQVREAVVFVEQIPAGLERKLARKSQQALVVQTHGHFVPSPMSIAAGTTVEFENHDTAYHNVFSVSSARRFNVGKYGPNQTRQVRFERTGLIKLFCDIDPAELGYLYVTPNHAYAQPDSTGAFALPNLPHGTYRLRVWSPDHRPISRVVEMPRRGDLSIALRL